MGLVADEPGRDEVGEFFFFIEFFVEEIFKGPDDAPLVVPAQFQGAIFSEHEVSHVGVMENDLGVGSQEGKEGSDFLARMFIEVTSVDKEEVDGWGERASLTPGGELVGKYKIVLLDENPLIISGSAGTIIDIDAHQGGAAQPGYPLKDKGALSAGNA